MRQIYSFLNVKLFNYFNSSFNMSLYVCNTSKEIILPVRHICFSKNIAFNRDNIFLELSEPRSLNIISRFNRLRFIKIIDDSY